MCAESTTRRIYRSADSSFDVVVCSEVLEHLLMPHLAAAQALRVLRDNGRMIVTVPNIAYWRDRVDAVFGLWQPGGDDLGRAEPWRSPHIRFFTPASLRRMLLEVGFDRVDIAGVPCSYLESGPCSTQAEPPTRPHGTRGCFGLPVVASGRCECGGDPEPCRSTRGNPIDGVASPPVSRSDLVTDASVHVTCGLRETTLGSGPRRPPATSTKIAQIKQT